MPAQYNFPFFLTTRRRCVSNEEIELTLHIIIVKAADQRKFWSFQFAFVYFWTPELLLFLFLEFQKFLEILLLVHSYPLFLIYLP